jgi:hypothetical protein
MRCTEGSIGTAGVLTDTVLLDWAICAIDCRTYSAAQSVQYCSRKHLAPNRDARHLSLGMQNAECRTQNPIVLRAQHVVSGMVVVVLHRHPRAQHLLESRQRMGHLARIYAPRSGRTVDNPLVEEEKTRPA